MWQNWERYKYIFIYIYARALKENNYGGEDKVHFGCNPPQKTDYRAWSELWGNFSSEDAKQPAVDADIVACGPILRKNIIHAWIYY